MSIVQFIRDSGTGVFGRPVCAPAPLLVRILVSQTAPVRKRQWCGVFAGAKQRRFAGIEIPLHQASAPPRLAWCQMCTEIVLIDLNTQARRCSYLHAPVPNDDGLIKHPAILLRASHTFHHGAVIDRG